MTSTNRSSVAVLCLVTACLGEPVASSPDEPNSALSINAFDPRGQPTDLNEIVRRPTLTIVTSASLSPSAPPVFLFDGPTDPELVEDLRQPPLRTAHEGRLLPASITVDQQTVSVTPSSALSPGQTVTLAIAAWAIGDHGERWTEDEPFVQALRVAVAAEAGASVTASWPAHGAAGVPINLAFAALGFDGAVESFPAQMTFESADDTVIATTDAIDCRAVGLSAHTCIRLDPTRELSPITTYAITTADGWIDATGSALEPWSAQLTTAASADHTPPQPADLACALDETPIDFGCALISDTNIQIRVATDEAALVTRETQDCASTTFAAFGAEATFDLRNLAPEHEQILRLELSDAAANTRAFEQRIVTRPRLPAITISEVRADPIGPEPQQEYVELTNYGDVAIDLLGYSLSDDAFDEGDVIERSVLLHPAGRALLVADDFDANDPRDVLPAPGAMLIRIGTSLAGGGLSNSGEPVFLRDPTGARLSETPSLASVGAGVCLQRRDLRTRDGSASSFVHDAERACTPGL